MMVLVFLSPSERSSSEPFLSLRGERGDRSMTLHRLSVIYKCCANAKGRKESLQHVAIRMKAILNPEK
ncbi:hypothetical protein NC651_027796 [Populus alba x Populus x berolinensis]|nr:hypothetical protein NC651_027796 [Populus alba x Populus x berolinensis]